MASDEQSPKVWEDDEKKVFFLPSRLTSSGAAQTVPTAEGLQEIKPAGEGEAEKHTESPFPRLAREQELDSARNRIEPFPELGEKPLLTAERPAAQARPREEPFDRPGTTRVGLLGGKEVGKSYLFHAMVYRTLDGKRSGALSYYIDGDSVRIYESLRRDSIPRSVIPRDFIREYTSWTRLPFTKLAAQRWFRLRLQFRTGIFGTRRSFLDIDFLDGAGESLEAGISEETEEIWKAAFLDARIMVFCLPLWAAFPASGGVLSDKDWEDREKAIRGFDAVIRHFKDLRERYQVSQPVRSILALTMADDRRSALATLRSRWITPFLEDPMPHLRALRTASGVARYLASARKVSEALWREFDVSPDSGISGIPVSIDFGGGRPWFIPVSAVDGAILDQPRSRAAPGLGQSPPVPVHVELPLLVALCQSRNALM